MSTIVRQLSNIDGASVPTPTQTGFVVNTLMSYASDAAFLVDNPTPQEGMLYWNTTEKVVRQYNGTTFQYDKLSLAAETNSTLTGANQDLTPAAEQSQIIRLTNATLTSIRSIAPTTQRLLWLINDQTPDGTDGVTLVNESAGATAANRIRTMNGQDLVIKTGQSVTLIYDEDLQRWRQSARSHVPTMEAFADDAAFATAHNPPVAGDCYWNTTTLVVREYNGTTWQNNKVLFGTENNTSLTGADADLVPDGEQIIKVSNASLTSIRSVTPAIQKFFILINGTGATISIKNEDTGATAANRILTGTGADLSLENAKSLLLVYDGNSTRWRIVGGTGSGSGSSGINLCTSPDTAVAWISSASPAATTTTTAAELPLGPLVPTAIKMTKTVAATYEEWRWAMPTGLMNMVIPISWYQIHEAGSASGDWKLDVYTYVDSSYTDGTKTRKPLRTDVSSVTSIPTGNGFFGGGNVVSFDAFAEVYYGMRITRVTNNKFLSLAHVKIGPGDNGVAPFASAPIAYTPTLSNFGTATSVFVEYTITTSQMRVYGRFTAGTVVAATAAMSLPLNYTTRNPGSNTQQIYGKWWRATAVGTVVKQGTIWGANGSNTVSFGYDDYTTPASPTGAVNANSVAGNGETVEFDFTVSISELTGNNPLLVGPALQVEYAVPTGTVDANGATNGTDSAIGNASSGYALGTMTDTRIKYIRWQNPPQRGDIIKVRVSINSGASFSEELNDWVDAATSATQQGVRYLDTDYTTGISRIQIGRYAYLTTNWASTDQIQLVKTSSAVLAGVQKADSNFMGLTMPRKGQTALTVTGTNWTTTRAVGIYYQDQDGAHRLKFNIRGTVSVGVTSLTLTVNVTFKSSFSQACYAQALGTAPYLASCGAVGNDLGVFASTSSTEFRISGDVELESKPSWA